MVAVTSKCSVIYSKTTSDNKKLTISSSSIQMSTFLFIILFGFLLKAYTSLHLTNKILFYFPQKKSRFVQIFTILVMLQCLYEQKKSYYFNFLRCDMYIFHFGMQKTFWVKLENLLKVLSLKKKGTTAKNI
jgi:hypothetical protein